MASKACLDLFCGLGGFHAAFEESDDWDVFTVDIEERFEPDLQADVMDLRPADLVDLVGGYDVLVILASPPCAVFCTAGNHDHWEDRDPVKPRSREHVTLVYHTLGLIHALSPDYWFLENPRGRLRWFLGEPEGTVTYCQYGTDYMKPTDLWGNHPPRFVYRSCSHGEDCHVSNGEDDGTSAIASMPTDYGERSAVPHTLSVAIRDACEEDRRRNAHEQSTLTDAR